MNFYWVYDLPNWLFAVLTISAFVAFSTIGLWISRRLVLRLFGGHPYNDVVSFYLSTAGVFYGITLGLIAVGTFTTFTDIDRGVSREAAAIAALYRNAGTYPEPARGELCRLMEDYTRFVIDEEWPKQRKGTLPPEGAERVTRLQETLGAFNPATEREKIIHAEALSQYNRMMEERRMRLQSVRSGLPLTMYMVVIVGAVLNIMVSWLFVVKIFRLHVFLNMLMAALLGLLVYLIAVMDNPFRGEFSVGPEAFEYVRDQLMKAESPDRAIRNRRH
jgi:Zn-dependent protease with chaperone function